MTSATRPDALPEHASYVDDGCKVSPTCLACPLPICKYDMGNHQQTLTAFVRAQAIRRDRIADPHATIGMLAKRNRCSVRTVARALADDLATLPIPQVHDVHARIRPSWGLSPIRYTA